MKDNLLEPDQEKIDQARQFLAAFASVILGSTDHAGQPHTSYAPTINEDGNYYVYVSGLAKHTATLTNGYASLLFIEDEHTAKNVFARTRLTFDCVVTSIDRDNNQYQTLLDQFQCKHGSTIKLLRTLPDFVLFELEPKKAAFVTGFGAAYDMTPHISDIV